MGKLSLDELLNSNSVTTRASVFSKSNKPNEENINKALDDKEVIIRYMAIKHKNATEANINKALDNSNLGIKITAMRHKNATKANIEKAMLDPELKNEIQDLKM